MNNSLLNPNIEESIFLWKVGSTKTKGTSLLILILDYENLNFNWWHTQFGWRSGGVGEGDKDSKGSREINKSPSFSVVNWDDWIDRRRGREHRVRTNLRIFTTHDVGVGYKGTVRGLRSKIQVIYDTWGPVPRVLVPMVHSNYNMECVLRFGSPILLRF